MRCPECNKFVAFEEQEPEVEEVEIIDGKVVTAVRIVNACEQCSTELKETTIEMEKDISEMLSAHRVECKHKDQHGEEDVADFNVDETSSERDTRSEGKGRYAKMFYGARVGFKIMCSHCSEQVGEGELEGFEQASFMDECV